MVNMVKSNVFTVRKMERKMATSVMQISDILVFSGCVVDMTILIQIAKAL